MPRFEMYLMYAEANEDLIETSEFEMVCWVDDPEDLDEVQGVANEVIQQHIEEAEHVVLFGTATVIIQGSEVMNIGFRNKEADPEDIDEVLELFGSTERETMH